MSNKIKSSRLISSALIEVDNNKITPKKIKNQAISMAFAIPFLIAFIIFFIYPFINGVYSSFLDKNQNFVFFKNYYSVLFDKNMSYSADFFRGLKNTLLYVVISVPLLIVIPLFIALLLELKPPGYKFFRAILFMPTVFSISSIVLMWKRVLAPGELGFVNSLLMKMNLNPIDFLGSLPWAWVSILVVTIWWTMGTNMVILGAGLKNIDRNMYEAASIDGASGVKAFYHITLPSLSGQLLVVLILTILASFNIYGQPQLLTSGGPERATKVLMMDIVENIGSKPYIAATMSMLLGLIMITVSLLQAVIMKIRGRK